MIVYDPLKCSKESILSITKNRQPDFNELVKVLQKKIPSRPTLFEFFFNDNLHDEILPRKDFEINDYGDLCIYRSNVFRLLGYDYVTLPLYEHFVFPVKEHDTKDSISLNDQIMIKDYETFESYPWPKIDKADEPHIVKVSQQIPAGMKVIVQGPGGILENLIALVGYDNLCFMLFDQPELLQLIVDKIGESIIEYYEHCLQHDVVGACIVNDDWGFITQTMLAPEDMRKYIIPWHKKIVKLIHDHGRPAIMHSCGNLWNVMDDIIDDIGFDAKHSYEDNITSVEESYDRLNGRIAVLGGIDVDYMCRKTPEEIYNRSKKMVEIGQKKGGYALGTGNSVPKYIPIENYYAMICAALLE